MEDDRYRDGDRCPDGSYCSCDDDRGQEEEFIAQRSCGKSMLTYPNTGQVCASSTTSGMCAAAPVFVALDSMTVAAPSTARTTRLKLPDVVVSVMICSSSSSKRSGTRNRSCATP